MSMAIESHFRAVLGFRVVRIGLLDSGYVCGARSILNQLACAVLEGVVDSETIPRAACCF